MEAAAQAAEALDVARYYSGWTGLLPEAIICIGSVFLLLTSAGLVPGLSGGSDAARTRRSGMLTLGFIGLALVASIAQAGTSATIFSGMVVIDPFVHFFRILFCCSGLLGVLISLKSDEVSGGNTGEYFSLFLALIAGMMLMSAASDLVMIYIAIELVSLMSYVLVGFRRHDRKGAEASLKYVIYGGAASGVMLYGFSLLYGLTGETQLSLMNIAVQEVVRTAQVDGLGATGSSVLPTALALGLVMSFAGFAYKIAAAPLHMWSPDVYEGAPTPFTAFLSTGPKAAGFALMIRFFVVGFSDVESFASNVVTEISTLPWPLLIIVISIVTMTVGNFAAIGQSNVKRFLAYSSIAHAGYSLIGLAAFSKAGIAAVLLYMSFYMLMNIGAFFSVIWLREKTGAERIDDYRGVGYRAPLVCICFTICLFSLTGLPPLAGFVGKYYLFAAALDRATTDLPVLAQCAPAMRESLGMLQRASCSLSGGGAFYALAIIGLLNSAVSLYYYARIVRKMFLERPDANATPIPGDAGSRLVLAPIAALLLLFGIYWAPLEARARDAVAFRRPTLAEVMPSQTPSQATANRPADAASESESAALLRPD